LVIGRWRLLPDQGKAAGNHTTASDASELPLWAAVMDHLLAGRAQEALECARQEAGEDSKGCVTKTGFDSFNLIRAELANGNWQAAVRLIGLRRGRGNVNYLDDYFLAVACLIAGQRRDAVAHFARVRKACEKYNASGRLEFELRMACGLRAHDVYWLTDAAREREAQPASAAGAATQAATPAPTAEVRGALRLLGSSAAMEAVCRQIASLAPLDVPVLIGGETGSGKELVARALHEAGPRASHPFLAVNCGAISESLLESELFGHERGAFTGAVAAHRGLFEEAGGGTILLDEIGDTPARLQVSLLRVLETGEFRPVGSAGSRRIRCRVLAATNADLASLAATGSFRRDLFYRLKRLAIDIPPLRERGRDAAELAVHFLAEGRPDGRQPELSPPLADALCRAAWPGNVRELRNVMERARLLNSEKLAYDLDDVELPTIHPAAVVTPAAAADAPVPSAPAAPAGAQDDVAAFLHRQRTGLRRLDRLRELFARHGKLTRAEAAAILGVTPKTATGDLRALCAEGLVEKVMPSASRRTHYFRLKREE
jgi:DNA-binding NtrC family response regulator